MDEFELFYRHHLRAGNYHVIDAIHQWWAIDEKNKKDIIRSIEVLVESKKDRHS